MATFPTILFWMGGTAAAVIFLTLLITLLTRFRLWPPGDDTLKAVLHWGLVGIFNICIVSIAVLKWNSWILPRPASLIAGVLLSVWGAAIFITSSRAMNATETTGQTATELYTEGLYARSRNPQYLGMMIGLVGFALLVNSLFVAILSLVHIWWLLLLPSRKNRGFENNSGTNTTTTVIACRGSCLEKQYC